MQCYCGMLCVVVIGFSFPKEIIVIPNALSNNQQHMNRVIQLYEVVNNDKGSLCVKMNELYRVSAASSGISSQLSRGRSNRVSRERRLRIGYVSRQAKKIPSG